ncbi:hypothetical protein HMPREF9069_00819 [Atopobium sp. oral taxon 810 str. F0209]|nr:hypothetical protein HMPREF9069_00819 [Atopobium sp. oral taxon 810 str. F0209]
MAFGTQGEIECGFWHVGLRQLKRYVAFGTRHEAERGVWHLA